MAQHVILGKGGHATAIRHWLLAGTESVRMTDDDNDVEPREVIHIGMGDLIKRRALYTRYAERVHADGIQIMRGVIRDPMAWIGHNVLINTGAQIDHDCVVHDHCIISPGAILCGGVKLGHSCQIGAGAIILQGVELDAETNIPAGTLVCGPNDLRKPIRILPNGEIPSIFYSELQGRLIDQDTSNFGIDSDP